MTLEKPTYGFGIEDGAPELAPAVDPINVALNGRYRSLSPDFYRISLHMDPTSNNLFTVWMKKETEQSLMVVAEEAYKIRGVNLKRWFVLGVRSDFPESQEELGNLVNYVAQAEPVNTIKDAVIQVRGGSGEIHDVFPKES